MDTRARILAIAEGLFQERGYHAATLQEIADRVGITKPALYYHFESKAGILGSLIEPVTTQLERVLDEAAGCAELGAVRTKLMTGWADVFLQFRGALLALFRELSAAPPGTFDRMLEVMERAVATAAGPEATGGDLVAVAQAISALIDPIAMLPIDLPSDTLREHLLSGVWRLLGEPTAKPARRAAGGGRPRSLSPADAVRARELHATGEVSAEAIAGLFGVSRATIYRIIKSHR